MSAFGNILGIRMTLLLGFGPVVLPAPAEALESIETFEIKMSAIASSGFKLVLHAGREGPLGLLGPPFVSDPRFQRDARIVVAVLFGVKPVAVFDGVITKSQYLPGMGDNEGKLVLLGRDLSHLLDLEERSTEHPAMDETVIGNLITAEYGLYGIIPVIMPPVVIDPPIPVDRTPHQACTDMEYLRRMARRHGYKTFIDPGPVPGTSQLYWGPIPRPGLPQKTLSVNLGPMTDATDVTITHNGETLTTVSAQVHDRNTGQTTPVEAPVATTAPQGAAPDSLTRFGQTRTTRMQTSGLNAMQAYARAQGIVNRSAEDVVEVTGTVNTVRYNDVLKPYQTVLLRGVGPIYNGSYTVAEVRHRISPGDYSQTFTLRRGELYALSPVVPPEVAPL